MVASSEKPPRRPTASELNDTAVPAPVAAILTTWRASHQPRYSGGTYTAIGQHVATALANGHAPDAIRAALTEWDRRADAKPGLLPHLLDDQLKARRPGAVTRPAIVNGRPTVPVDQIRDEDINPDTVLGPDVWTMPPPPREIENTPAEDTWVREKVAARLAERRVEARRALMRQQNRSTA